MIAGLPGAPRHLFVTQDYAPDLGGMARRHVELCRRTPAGATMTVSTVAAGEAGHVFDRNEAYPIARQAFPFTGAKRFVNQLRWSRSLLAGWRTGGATVLHCGNIRPCGYAVRIASARAGLPYVVYVYGGDVLRELRKTSRNALKRRSARSILGGAAGIVAISTWTADRTRELLGAIGVRRAPPVADIPLGTDPHHFHPSRDRGDLRRRLGIDTAPLLVTVARLVPHKGQDTVIRALTPLSTLVPGVRYLVIGEGHDAARLRALAVACGVADRVIFAGALSDADVAEAYATATLYVGLSRVEDEVSVEGFGLSFVEAGASGVPSIAGDSGGVRSAVRDGETGIVVPPGEVEAVVRAASGLLLDPERRATMGRSARRAVEEHYNWDRVARETFAFVDEAVRAWH